MRPANNRKNKQNNRWLAWDSQIVGKIRNVLAHNPTRNRHLISHVGFLMALNVLYWSLS